MDEVADRENVPEVQDDVLQVGESDAAAADAEEEDNMVAVVPRRSRRRLDLDDENVIQLLDSVVFGGEDMVEEILIQDSTDSEDVEGPGVSPHHREYENAVDGPVSSFGELQNVVESDDDRSFVFTVEEDNDLDADDWQVFAVGDHRDRAPIDEEEVPHDLPRSIFHAQPSQLMATDISVDHDCHDSLAATLSTTSHGPYGNPRAQSRKAKGGVIVSQDQVPWANRHMRLLLCVISFLLVGILAAMVVLLMRRNNEPTNVIEIDRGTETINPAAAAPTFANTPPISYYVPTPVPLESSAPQPTHKPVGAGLPTIPVEPLPPTQSSSPPNKYCGMQTPGTLVIDGGELQRSPDIATIQAMVEALGGTAADKSLVVIPSAGAVLEQEERDEYTRLWTQEIGFDPEKFAVLHPELNDPERVGVEDAAESLTQAFVAPIQTSDAVFIRGGRQWRLMDAFKFTRVVDELWNLLERGGLIAGTSAGATSQGFFMPRGDPSGSGNLFADREWHQYGFGFLPGVAFDVHVDGRDRWEDLYQVVAEHPELLGIGISEYTAIVVKGKYFQVVGDATVAIYKCDDYASCNGTASPYEELFPGQWFDLCEQMVVPEPNVSDLQVAEPRQLSLPYDFTHDYRLGAEYFSCSGRYCRWTSSIIDTANFPSTVLSAKLESIGSMEPADFIRVSYRIEMEAPGLFGEWSDTRTFFTNWRVAAEQVGDIGNGYFFTAVTLGESRKMQIRVEAQTSVEEFETLIVRDLVAANTYLD